MSRILRLTPKPGLHGKHPSCPVIPFIMNPLSPIYSPLCSGVKMCNRESILLFNTALSEAHLFPRRSQKLSSPPTTHRRACVEVRCRGRTGGVWITNEDKQQGTALVSSPVLTRSPALKLLRRSWRAQPRDVQVGAATCVLCSPSAWVPVGGVGGNSILQGQEARHAFLTTVNWLCDLGHVSPLP